MTQTIFENFNIKDFVSDYDAESVHGALGIDDKRGGEISSEFSKIVNNVQGNKEGAWSISLLMKEVLNKDFITSYKELALMMYLMGCVVGESTVMAMLANGVKETHEKLNKVIMDTKLRQAVAMGINKDEAN